MEFLAKHWLNKSLFVIGVLFKIILLCEKRNKFVRKKKVGERKDKWCDQGKEGKVISIIILSKLLPHNFSSPWLKIGEKKICIVQTPFPK